TIKPNPKIPIAALKDQLQKKFELGVSKAKVFRAKQMAQDNVIGDFVNQYARLKDYALELQEQNPDTTIKIDVERTCDPTSDTRKFGRIYILTAVGVDPNNGTYPLAYAVVEAETKYSWTWFLDCLGDDLQLVRNSNFTFITDRQKGLILALQEMFPAAEHRYCLKHIYDNMKLSWRGQQYKELLWKCATSQPVQLFNKNMEELRSINKEVYDWLKFKINPCNGPNMWKKLPSPITLTPPDYHTPVGRLAKKRKKSAAELFDGMVKKGKLSRAASQLLAPNVAKQTAPFLRPTAPFVTLRFTKNTTNRLSPIKKPAGANGKGKNCAGMKF
ncbi:mutator type transposase, partial [Tanacetum coccineum]